MKQEQRHLIKQQIKTLTSDEKRVKSHQICEKLLPFLLSLHPRIVLSYRATKDEVDLHEVDEILIQHGIAVCYPKVDVDNMHAYFSNTFTVGSFGIMEPLDGTLVDAQDIDVVLVPCVGFDAKGHRLGHGKGYYDRYLSQTNAYRLVVGFSMQQLDVIVTEPHDIVAQAWVNENELQTVSIATSLDDTKESDFLIQS